ncbi:hypothetical protein V5P93_003927 [Actinokineospora auranticolor]|uniref:Uncharacterized protein n=1 Tax=Actinokineospora auranticolor TaxID=155976 RepID=A0A2S6GLU3_9PSEU|nr:hypothetical protein [Actinokineospora auranticolor]PPK66209.1 hypothetical protein CLV40_111173 [Actinokineospora auranticolor]
MDLLPTAVFPSGYSAAAWLVGACWGGDPAGEWALLPAEGSTRRWERPARPGRLGDRFRVRVWRWLLSGQSLAVGVGVGDSVAFWVGVRPAHYGTCCCAAGSTVLWRAEDPARPDQSVARVAVVTGGSGR